MGYRANAVTDECGYQLINGLSIHSGLQPQESILADKVRPPQLPKNMTRIADASFLFDESRIEGDKRLAKYNLLASIALRKEKRLGQVTVGQAKIGGKMSRGGRMLYLKTDAYLYASKLDGTSYQYWKL